MKKIFHIQAKDTKGNLISTVIEGKDVKNIAKELQKSNYTIIDVKEAKINLWSQLWQLSTVKQENLVFFLRELSATIKAGLTLFSALSILIKDESNKTFKEVLKGVYNLVGKGLTFSDSLARYPAVFSKIIVSFVRMGEIGGCLSAALERLSWLEEKELNIKKQVKASLTYPFFIASAMFVLLYIIFFWIFPPLMSLFKGYQVELPVATKLIIDTISLVTNTWFFALFFVIAVSLIITYKVYLNKNINFKMKIDQLKLSLPLTGLLLRKVIISRFTRTVGTLYQQGIPILTSVKLAGELCDNLHFTALVVNPLLSAISQGQSFSAIFNNNPLVPKMVATMISVGEYSGEISKSLQHIAQYYEMDILIHLQQISAQIEPILIFILGIFVAVALLSIYLPIYTLISKIS